MRKKVLSPGIFFAVIITLCIVAYLSSFIEARQEGRRWAVVVGIDKYNNEEVIPLRCAANDAREFARTLRESAGFNPDDIFLLTSDDKGNRSPERGYVVQWISHIQKYAGPDDTFIFFFSGHGIDIDKESYILTIEANPFSADTLDTTSLKISDLRRYIGGIQAGTILIFVDACRNDPRTGKGTKDNILTENFSKNLIIAGKQSPDGRAPFSATFFSCQVGQRSYEWREQNMGFFTYYLVKGLRGDARNEKGIVTLNSLDEYLGKNVKVAVDREKNAEQEPWTSRMGPSGSGELPISQAGVAAVKTRETPAAPTVTVTVQPKPTVTVTMQPEIAATVTVTPKPSPIATVTVTPKPVVENPAPNEMNAPDSVDPRLIAREEAAKYASRGDDYFNAGNYKSAIEEYSRAIEKDPSYDAAYENRGVAHERQGDYNRAIADHTKALEINSNDALYYFNRGLAYYRKEDFDRAIADYTKAIAINPDYTSAYNNRGVIYKSRKDYDRAIADFNKTISLNPNHANAYSNRGEIYRNKGDNDSAISDYTRAIAIDPNHADYYYDRGITYKYKKDYKNAIADFRAYIRLAPSSATEWINRANDLINEMERR